MISPALCQIEVRADEARRREPVTVGIPLPRGWCHDPEQLALSAPDGTAAVVQTTTLDRWHDGSVRWVLVDFLATVDASGSAHYRLARTGSDHTQLLSGAALHGGLLVRPPGPDTFRRSFPKPDSLRQGYGRPPKLDENGLAKAEARSPKPDDFFTHSKAGPHGNQPASMVVRHGDEAVTIDTGVMVCELSTSQAGLFGRVAIADQATIDASRSRLRVEDEDGVVRTVKWTAVVLESDGPVRSAVRLDGYAERPDRRAGLDVTARIDFYAGSPTARVALTLRNPRPARHPGGFWELGDAGSVHLRDVALELVLPDGSGPTEALCSVARAMPPHPVDLPFELYQESSGGENWRSSAHCNKGGAVPHTMRGYRMRTPQGDTNGLRATPIVRISRGDRLVTVAMERFWENFPKAIEIGERHGLTLRLFPHQYPDAYELQGGEQKTHTMWLSFGEDTVTDGPLEWCRTRAVAHASPEWYASANAVQFLVPAREDTRSKCLSLINAAVDGEHTFVRKREVVDEYGWRHFGDLYADHEAVFHQGPAPRVSHFNNQYDAAAGCAIQFLRTVDSRWKDLLDELTAHVIDIDIYHTDRDRAAYSGGLFWHTFHHVDAGTSTHRTYPHVRGVPGGGPGSEHNYTTGLMLHHFLTGDLASRDAVIGLARWVMAMDDGRRTRLGWLDGGDTGLASATRSPSYHGPGRGAGNSIQALLDAFRLTGDAAFLTKAEELIRRCIHPADDIDRRQLLDRERRWSYVIFLQALARYLDDKAERGADEAMFRFARASLLHYARWMLVHERPYLDNPELLEFPNETWAAHELRKSAVLNQAALHTSGEERGRLLDRARFFFDAGIETLIGHDTRTLAGHETRTLTRPIVILLACGYVQAWFDRAALSTAEAASVHDEDFGTPEVFVPQRERVRQRALAAPLWAAGLIARVRRGS